MTRLQFLMLSIVAVALAWYLTRRKGTVTPGKGVVLATSRGRLVDPCPGNDVIWDAPTGKCIPLVEEPVESLVA